MAVGLYVRDDGTVVVAYGTRQIALPRAQYKANGYKPELEKLPLKPAAARARVRRPNPDAPAPK